MNKVPILVFLSLLVLLLMQLGASLFAITVTVSTLVESPPESLAMTQGDFPYAFGYSDPPKMDIYQLIDR